MTFLPYLEAFEWLWSWMKRKPKPEPVLPATQPSKPKQLKILVVEDSADDSLLLAHHLEYCGQTATFAKNAEAAQALIHKNNLDMVFVDLRLTYMPGWDLIPIIWRESPHSLVVVICGLIEDLAKIPKPHKMMVVMTKPVSADDLCSLFEKLNVL